MVNGILQARGATLDYTISGNNTVVFTEDVENADHIVITYIKG
jgi:hypothetical protein